MPKSYSLEVQGNRKVQVVPDQSEDDRFIVH